MVEKGLFYILPLEQLSHLDGILFVWSYSNFTSIVWISIHIAKTTEHSLAWDPVKILGIYKLSWLNPNCTWMVLYCLIFFSVSDHGPEYFIGEMYKNRPWYHWTIWRWIGCNCVLVGLEKNIVIRNLKMTTIAGHSLTWGHIGILIITVICLVTKNSICEWIDIRWLHAKFTFSCVGMCISHLSKSLYIHMVLVHKR